MKMIYMSEVNKIYKIDSKTFLSIIKNMSDVIRANEEYLTKLDAAIGDADHGINMVRGFEKITELINKYPNPDNLDIGTVLQQVGMGILQVVGGAAGPLYGMFFLEASKAVAGKKEITVEDFIKMLENGLRGAVTIGGGTQPGEKTMIDVLQPVVMKLKEIVSKNPDVDFIEALNEVVPYAREQVIKTIPMLAKKGRASYLGERSIGHQDPGATSVYLIIRTFLDTLTNRKGIKITKYDENSGKILEEQYLEN